MASVSVPHLDLQCLTLSGGVLARLKIAPIRVKSGQGSLLFSVSAEEARSFCEEQNQLCERGRYEYILTPETGVTSSADLALRPSSAVKPSGLVTKGEDRGLIEPGDACGLLSLEVVCRSAPSDRALAFARIEVRPVKLASSDEYRGHYRGMLSHIADRCAGLLLDCHAPTRLRLDTLWKVSPRILEQQLEFLRHTLESASFRAAVDEVLRNPHRRLDEEREERDISRPFKTGKDFARQIAVSSRRVAVPETHPLYKNKIHSLPACVCVQSRTDFFDTAENRFAKMVLSEFRDFLADVAAHLARKVAVNDKPEMQRSLREAEWLRGVLETQLTRGFFPDVSPPTVLPLGSPVLQRKAGYRELVRFWLRFHAGAQLAWDGGAEVFEAGARNVATLYEYWLFFQLETLFRRRFACEQPLHALVVNKDKVPPQLVLKRGVELRTPVAGVCSKTAGRRLNAEFHFNRKFTARTDRDRAGSWTRGVQPDYTISIWPTEYSKQEAEQNELMVHVHFDAKYRVEHAGELLGDSADDEAFKKDAESKDEVRSAAKYADLLKMHAYRDAVRRTAGAYVLYPGAPCDPQMFEGFHEVLPGLGAFAIRPDRDGRPEGMGALEVFLDKVIEHLANRTTARERLSYHVVESYTLKDEPVPYGSLHLPESDIYGKDYRALPPAEDMVLVAWYENDAQLELAQDEAGFAYVRLGRRQGGLHVHPNLARVRHIVMRTHGGIVASGFLNLREAGFRVFTRTQLRAELNQHAKGSGVAGWEASAGRDDEEHIYALFRTTADPLSEGQNWLGEALMEQIESFESDVRNTLIENVRRTSPYPRILSLTDVLKARA